MVRATGYRATEPLLARPPCGKSGQAETQRIAMWRLLSRVRYSVTEESRLQSILAISVVSTKDASLRAQSRFDCDAATIR
jgi:hypothetical protein